MMFRGSRLAGAWRAVIVGVLAAASGGARPGSAMPAGPAGKASDGIVILDGFSYWRAHLQVSAPVIRHGESQLQGHPAALEPLPKDWTALDFDDTTWVRTPGPFFNGKYEAGFQGWESVTPNLALICLRGKFSVTDPGKVTLFTLDMTFRGGAVVYLNGTEIARKHLPEGAIEPSTLADDYPKEAYVRPDGQIIRHAYGDPERFPDRLALRRRQIEGLAIDPKRLRPGTNVIAIELHRAPYDEAATSRTRDGVLVPRGSSPMRPELDRWATVGLTRLTLTAVGTGMASSRLRPVGFQVWNSDPVMPVYETDFGDAGCLPLPVSIVAARNGRFQGVLVAGSDQAIRGLKARVTDLRHAKGTGAIPASAVSVRYQLPGPARAEAERVPGVRDVRGFDALLEEPPDEVAVRTKERQGDYPVVFGAVCPIWFTVHVPADAAPGTYEGTCRIEADGADPVAVPLRVTVSGDWTLPPPQQFRTLTGFHQSPESVAMQYRVPLWSDEHFRLMGETFKWLGSVGCKTVFLHAIERTNMGNEWSMVRWVRKKPLAEGEEGGTVSPETHDIDWSVVDKYLDGALEHLGKPPVICLYAWDNYCGTYYSGGATSSHNVKPGPVRVTELVDGKPASAFGARYDEHDKAVAFWKPVAEGFRDRLRKRGLEKSLMIGIAHDSWPGKYVVDVWKELLPDAPWAFEGHPRASQMYGVPVGWGCTVWGARQATPAQRQHGWRLAQMQCHFDRDCWRGSAGQQLLATGYLAGEGNIAGQQRGFGRMNADFWPLLKSNREANYLISARFPESDWGACNLRMTAFVQPGPNGAVSTGRLEMMREGLQECEARIFIEEALLDPAKKAKLGDDLAARCWSLLDRRVRALANAGGRMGTLVFLGSGRQARSRELFELAGEVAAKLKD